MKITLGSKTLLKKLQSLSGVISSKTTLPILENFLFEIDLQKLKITASDIETTMSTTLDIVSDETGNIAIPAKMLLEILKAFPDQPLTLEVLKNNTIEISSLSGNYAIAYEKGDAFPKSQSLQNPSTTVIPSKVLATALSKTIFATGNDDLRPVMCGVLFQFLPDAANFVSTDAHKLVKYSRGDIKSAESLEFIMPKKSLTVLKSILAVAPSDVIIEFNDSNARFTFEDYVLNCRLIDGKYPNYEGVIPKENPNVMTIDRVLLLNSVKCIAIFSNKQTHQVRLKITGNELNISAEDVDYSNKGDECLTCSYNGKDMMIGFNAKYLIEMLSNINCQTVQIEMSVPNRAGVLSPVDGLEEGEKVLMLLMPSLIN